MKKYKKIGIVSKTDAYQVIYKSAGDGRGGLINTGKNVLNYDGIVVVGKKSAGNYCNVYEGKEKDHDIL